MKITKARAYELRKLIMKAAESLDDKDASAAAELFGKLILDGSLVKVGTRINWNGVVKRAAVDLWATAENTPDAAPSLWEDLEYINGIRVIPEVITVGTAFAMDELGYWNGLIYRSKNAANVWTPDAAPDQWELVE